MINIRNPKYGEISDKNISVQILFNEDDPNHHDHHQEPHEDGGCPPSTGRFLMVIMMDGVIFIELDVA